MKTICTSINVSIKCTCFCHEWVFFLVYLFCSSFHIPLSKYEFVSVLKIYTYSSNFAYFKLSVNCIIKIMQSDLSKTYIFENANKWDKLFYQIYLYFSPTKSIASKNWMMICLPWRRKELRENLKSFSKEIEINI